MTSHVNMLGVGLNPVTYQSLFERIDEWISDKEGRSHHIACVNA